MIGHARSTRPAVERYFRRVIHPTAGSRYTFRLTPAVEPPIWVVKREHHDRPWPKTGPRYPKETAA